MAVDGIKSGFDMINDGLFTLSLFHPFLDANVRYKELSQLTHGHIAIKFEKPEAKEMSLRARIQQAVMVVVGSQQSKRQ